ncbi:hypothetical protein [Mycolicibacterium sarraceniae]|uniref:PE family protein n=1 Tax=Mycolicibacterium sarraceniae TaxID=1534348 RepID=A0A7I7STJ8_9MYCO|nr:hypothetical protein [Mycolicibacterium sarraceniae]BBY59641.1 hypothetical protein MSAR_27770 [Mycolicibacterium sarraceniae]
MTVSSRSYLTAGMAALVVGAMTIAPVQPSAPASITMNTIRLSAAAQPLVNQVNTAAATLGQAAPAAAAQQPQAQKTAQANNNVSNAIEAAYGAIMYWANYLALDLGPFLLGWIPFGYLISDQISIWYPNFTVPVADAIVYNFLVPVVNDFWNPTVWRDGLTAVANATRVGLSTVVNQQIAYFLTLQWFPFPPLPPLPFAATKSAAAAASSEAATTKAGAAVGTSRSARPGAAKESAETLTAAADTDTTETTASAEPTDGTDSTVSTSVASKTAKADSTDASSGKSSSATSVSGAPKKQSSAGSTRGQGPKASKADRSAK